MPAQITLLDEPQLKALLDKKHWDGFKKATWDIFNATGHFVDIVTGATYEAPQTLKKRPKI